MMCLQKRQLSLGQKKRPRISRKKKLLELWHSIPTIKKKLHRHSVHKDEKMWILIEQKVVYLRENTQKWHNTPGKWTVFNLNVPLPVYTHIHFNKPSCLDKCANTYSQGRPSDSNLHKRNFTASIHILHNSLIRPIKI